MAHLLVLLFLQGLFVNSKYIRDYFINFVVLAVELIRLIIFSGAVILHIYTDYAEKLLAEIHFLKIITEVLYPG